jgi:hypothetical protein
MKTPLAVILAAAACTHTYEYPTTLPPDVLAEKTVRLELRSGRTVEAHAVGQGDAILWRSEDNELFSASDIRALERMNRGRGSRDGAVLGFAIGFLTGAIIGFRVGGDDRPCGDLCNLADLTRGAIVIFAGLGVGGLGAFLGYLAGDEVGSTDRYELGAEAPKVSVRPSAHGAALQAAWSF